MELTLILLLHTRKYSLFASRFGDEAHFFLYTFLFSCRSFCKTYISYIIWLFSFLLSLFASTIKKIPTSHLNTQMFGLEASWIIYFFCFLLYQRILLMLSILQRTSVAIKQHHGFQSWVLSSDFIYSTVFLVYQSTLIPVWRVYDKRTYVLLIGSQNKKFIVLLISYNYRNEKDRVILLVYLISIGGHHTKR